MTSTESHGRAPGTDDESALLEFLRDRDLPCPICGYNLRNLTSARCPECGRALRLTVGAIDQPMAAYVTMLVCALLPAGIGLFLLVITLIDGPPSSGSEAFPYFVLMCASGWSAIVIAAVAVIFRRRILRQTPRRQWTMALMAIACLLAMIGGIFALVWWRL